MLAGFLARLGVIGLDDRFDQDDIRFADHFFDVVGFLKFRL